MLFGMSNLEKIWHENLTGLSTSPVRYSHFTFGNPKKSFSAVLVIHTSDHLYYLRRKQTVIHLPTPPENVTNVLWIAKLNVCCILLSVGGSEKRQLWVVISGSEKNQLWCMATGMSGKQCHSKCSEWPPSALIHASSLFRHWSVALYTTLCWNSALVATSRCCKPQRVHTKKISAATMGKFAVKWILKIPPHLV